MDRIDRSQRGVEKFLSLKALRGLKEGRGRRAGRLGARERRFQRGAAFFLRAPGLAASGGYSPAAGSESARLAFPDADLNSGGVSLVLYVG